MRPTPRKLALLMSVAGLGLSLGEAVHAGTDPAANARPMVGLGLSNRWDDRYAYTAITFDGMSVPALATPLAAPLNRTLGAADEAVLAAASQAFGMEASASRHVLAVGPSSVPLPLSQDDRDANALAMVLMAEPPSHSLAVPTAPTSPGVPATPEEPAAPGRVAAIPLRQPEGPPISAEDWEWTAVPGRDPDETLALDKDVAREPGPVAEDGVGATPGADEAPETARVDRALSLGLDPNLDWGASVGLGLLPSLDLNLELGPASGLDLNLDLGPGLDLNLGMGPSPSLDLNLELGPGRDLNLEPGPGVGLDLNLDLGPGLDLNLGMGPGPSLDLNLELGPGRDLNLEPGPGVGLDLNLDLGPGLDLNLGMGPGPSLDLNLELGLALDLNLELGSGAGLDLNLDLSPGLDLGLGLGLDLRVDPEPVSSPSVAPSVAMLATAASLGAARSEGSCTADPTSGLADQASEIVVASHADRVMRSLEALLSGDDPASGRFGAQTQEVMVASHAEKTLLMLASTRHRAGAPRRTATETQVEHIPFAAAQAQGPLPVSSAALVAGHTEREAVGKPSDQPTRIGRSAMGEGLLALSERNLDQVRGGFLTDSGLQISFGIERAVYINGTLVTTTSLNVSELGKVTGGQIPVSSVGTGSGSSTLIQNGAGNTFTTGAVSAATLGTVVQNTLNDQKIQSLTVVNATVNSLQLLKSQNFESSLRSAVIDSLRR